MDLVLNDRSEGSTEYRELMGVSCAQAVTVVLIRGRIALSMQSWGTRYSAQVCSHRCSSCGTTELRAVVISAEAPSAPGAFRWSQQFIVRWKVQVDGVIFSAGLGIWL